MRTVKLRRGTASRWSTINPVLAEGEPGVETDTHRVKLGDGTTDWNQLPYPTGSAGPQGPKGDQGTQGIQGLQGLIGPQGIQGVPGAPGAPGAGGSTATTAAQGIVKVDHNSAGDPVALTAAGHGAAADPHPQYATDADLAIHAAAADPHPVYSFDTDPRFTDARVPTAHKVSHQDGGTDEIVVTGLSGVLADPQPPIIGAGAAQAVAGNDARLTDARTPTAHKVSHQDGGTDEISVTGLSGVLADPQPPIIGAGAAQAVAGNDARLTDARTPTAHKASHQNGGADQVNVGGLLGVLNDPQPPIIGATGTTAVAGNDARLTNARTPTAHAPSHIHSGTDPLFICAKKLSADFTNNAVALTKVTNLDFAMGIGSFIFEYVICYRSAALTTGISFAVNHSGTVTTFVWDQVFGAIVAADATAGADQDQILATAAPVRVFSSRAKFTTVRGVTISVDTANADMLMRIYGLAVVTVAGNLELWCGSEVAASQVTVKAGSIVRVTRGD